MMQDISPDTAMAKIARDLADALMRFARDRHVDDKKDIATLQTVLCHQRKKELAAAPEPEEPMP
jgi:hypothetical protein